MKTKRFYLILIGLIIVGIGSVFMHKQQEEARALEFEGYEIESIEKQVDDLYNEEKTDIRENISGELINLEQIFAELNKKDLSFTSKNRIEKIEELYLTAKQMYELERSILEIFIEEDVVKSHVTLDMIDELEVELQSYEDKTLYYTRNNSYIGNARVQIETIKEATKMVNELSKEDLSYDTINHDEIEKVIDLVKQIKDDKIKTRLMSRLEAVQLALEESEAEEELLDEEEEMDEIEEVLEEEQLVETDEDLVNDQAEATEEAKQNTAIPERSVVQNNQPVNNRPSQTPSNNNNTSQTPRQPSNPPTNQNSNPVTVPEEKPAANRNSVKEVKLETKEEVIPYSTEIIENDIFNVGTEIIKEGVPGKKTVVYEIIVYQNGTSSRKVLSEQIVESTPRRVTIGTNDPTTSEELPPEEEVGQ